MGIFLEKRQEQSLFTLLEVVNSSYKLYLKFTASAFCWIPSHFSECYIVWKSAVLLQGWSPATVFSWNTGARARDVKGRTPDGKQQLAEFLLSSEPSQDAQSASRTSLRPLLLQKKLCLPPESQKTQNHIFLVLVHVCISAVPDSFWNGNNFRIHHPSVIQNWTTALTFTL